MGVPSLCWSSKSSLLAPHWRHFSPSFVWVRSFLCTYLFHWGLCNQHCVKAGHQLKFPVLWDPGGSDSKTLAPRWEPASLHPVSLSAELCACLPVVLWLRNLHVYMYAKSLHSCPTLCNPLDCSLPGCSVHGILQARILEWVAMASYRGSSRPRDRTHMSRIGRQVLLPLAPPGKPSKSAQTPSCEGAQYFLIGLEHSPFPLMSFRTLCTWSSCAHSRPSPNFWAIAELCFVIADIVVIVLYFHVVWPSSPWPSSP